MAKKTGLKQVKDALDELLKAAHSAAADAEPRTDVYVALADLIGHAEASHVLLDALMEVHNG